MTNRLPKHLHDALTAARRACEFLGEIDADGYRANVLVRSAVERQLEMVNTVRHDLPRLQGWLQAELFRFPLP